MHQANFNKAPTTGPSAYTSGLLKKFAGLLFTGSGCIDRLSISKKPESLPSHRNDWGQRDLVRIVQHARQKYLKKKFLSIMLECVDHPALNL
jgi:hypothetical protein